MANRFLATVAFEALYAWVWLLTAAEPYVQATSRTASVLRLRLARLNPLYWHGQFVEVSARLRVELQEQCARDQAQTRMLVAFYETRLARADADRATAVRCYESMLADRDNQIAGLSASLRRVHALLDESVGNTIRDSDRLSIDSWDDAERAIAAGASPDAVAELAMTADIN